MMGSEKRILYTLGADSFEEIEQRFEDIINQILKEKSTLMDKLKMFPLLKEASRWLPVNHRGAAPCQEVVKYNAKRATCQYSNAGRRMVVGLSLFHLCILLALSPDNAMSACTECRYLMTTPPECIGINIKQAQNIFRSRVTGSP